MHKQPSQRQLKVGEELRHIISDVLMRGDFYMEGSTQSLQVTVSEVRISPDLRNATVYVMPFGGKNQETTLKNLEVIAPQLRTAVSKKVRLRHAPALFFKIDKTFDQVSKIDNLLRDEHDTINLDDNITD